MAKWGPFNEQEAEDRRSLLKGNSIETRLSYDIEEIEEAEASAI